MICPKCGVEYSDKVCKIHISNCKGVEVVENHEELKEQAEELQEEIEESEEEIRAKAKELKIKSWHVKSIERLKEEMAVL